MELPMDRGESSSKQIDNGKYVMYTPQKRKFPRVQAVGEDYELKQMSDMASARKRWESLVKEGKMKAMSPTEAGYAIQLSNKTLLDSRPETEGKKRDQLEGMPVKAFWGAFKSPHNSVAF